jgi:hypothetical protein
MFYLLSISLAIQRHVTATIASNPDFPHKPTIPRINFSTYFSTSADMGIVRFVLPSQHCILLSRDVDYLILRDIYQFQFRQKRIRQIITVKIKEMVKHPLNNGPGNGSAILIPCISFYVFYKSYNVLLSGVGFAPTLDDSGFCHHSPEGNQIRIKL